MTNLERLQKVADGLEELNEQVVYVGGTLPGLYATDPAAPEPRATMDVDCIVDYGTMAEREMFERWLRQKRFSEYQGEDTVICRWSFEGELVDIMPTDERFYGFTNKWYKQGMQSKVNLRPWPRAEVATSEEKRISRTLSTSWIVALILHRC